MEHRITPAFAIHAVHPAWMGQMEHLATHPEDAAKSFEAFTRAYLGPAFASSLMGYRDGDVYQISENEYYSYHDGLRYFVSDTGKRIAQIPLQGLFYDYSYGYLAKLVTAAEDKAYSGAIILANSPGGMISGMGKLEKAISNYSKPIGVFVSGMLASAAAYVTAKADLILTDSEAEENTLGSIGIFSVQQNFHKNHELKGIETKVFRNAGASLKFKPNSFEPWDETDLEGFQAKVDIEGEKFHAQMEAGRKLSASQMEEIKKAGTYTDDQALSLGLIDGRATRDEAINKIASYNHQLSFI